MSPAGSCTQRNDFGYPTCFTTVFNSGKLYFRLGTYGYSRTRASDACNVMGGYLAVTKSQEEHEVGYQAHSKLCFTIIIIITFISIKKLIPLSISINNLLQAEVAPALFAVMTNQANTESWIGLTLMSSLMSSKWYGVTCRSFHICQSFELNPLSNFLWDDCDDPSCSMCDDQCSQVTKFKMIKNSTCDLTCPICYCSNLQEIVKLCLEIRLLSWTKKLLLYTLMINWFKRLRVDSVLRGYGVQIGLKLSECTCQDLSDDLQSKKILVFKHKTGFFAVLRPSI